MRRTKHSLPWIKCALFILVVSGNVFAQEICANGVDDDSDGLVDLNDIGDCECNSVTSVNSLIPNPSFEEYDCIPVFFGELSCADTWEQATIATSDYFLNVPGGFWDPIIPMPVPDGQGIGGFIISSFPIDMNGSPPSMYNEYIGGCLLAPLEAGIEYTLQIDLAGSSWDGATSAGAFYGPIDITIFGTTSCPQWPILLDSLGLETGCPTTLDEWVELGHTAYSADGTWQTISIQFIPSSDIQAVMIGGPCELPADFNVDGINVLNYPYFWIDNLLLNETSLFSAIETSGGYCTDDLVLLGTSDSLSNNYQWYYNGIAMTGQTDTLLEWSDLNLSLGNYQFIAYQNDTTCAGSQITISMPEPVIPVIGASALVGCEPLTVEFDNLTPPTSIACDWIFGDGGTSEECNPTYQYSESGVYNIGLSVTMENGCTYDTTYQQFIEVVSPPEATIIVTPQPTTVNDTQLSFYSEGDLDIVQWIWNFGEVLPFTDTAETATILFPPIPGNYPIELVVINSTGCLDTIQSNVIIYSDGSTTFPNIFSPDGDGLNELFKPFETYPGSFTLTIYNRWGVEVFSTTNLSLGWTGADSPAGTYYWVLQPLGSEQGESQAGYVTLVKN
jgi:PKD repeat protein